MDEKPWCFALNAGFKAKRPRQVPRMSPKRGSGTLQGWDKMQVEAQSVCFYVFLAMLAGRGSMGEGQGEMVNPPPKRGLDTLTQRVDGFGGSLEEPLGHHLGTFSSFLRVGIASSAAEPFIRVFC